MLTQILVGVQAVLRDHAQFKVDLVHELQVPPFGNRPSGRRNINQTPDDAALGVSDLYRLVGTHKKKSIGLAGIAGLELFIDHHVFVRHHRVHLGVVLNPVQLGVGVDGYQRIAPKRLGGKVVAVPHQVLGAEGFAISIEQFFNDLQDRAFAGARVAIEHSKLLNGFAVTAQNRADAPLNLGPLVRVVQRADQFLKRRARSIGQRISKPFADIVGLLYLRVCERQVLIQQMKIVRQVFHIPDKIQPGRGRKIAAPLYGNLVRRIHMGSVFAQVVVDDLANIIRVGAPQSVLFIPHRVEVFSADHQVLALFNDEFRIHFTGVFLGCPLADFVKVHALLFLLSSENITAQAMRPPPHLCGV